VLWRHLLRNSLIAVVTLVGLSIPLVITGTLIIEQVFNFPGTGLEYYQAVLRNDYEVMLGITVLVGVVTVFGNLMADIGYAVLDPRIRY
jgi:peptide/nickel transport system permease protein